MDSTVKYKINVIELSFTVFFIKMYGILYG